MPGKRARPVRAGPPEKDLHTQAPRRRPTDTCLDNTPTHSLHDGCSTSTRRAAFPYE